MDSEAAELYAGVEGTITFRVSGRGVGEISYTLQAVSGPEAEGTSVAEPRLPWFAVVDARGIGLMPMLTIILNEDDAHAQVEILQDGELALRGSAAGSAATAVFMVV